MCVIGVVLNDKNRMTAEMVEACHHANNQGMGVAWRLQDGPPLPNDKSQKPTWRVHWRKGITDFHEMQKMAAELPTPYVMHFRISSCGDNGRLDLTHPFPVDYRVPLWLKGTTSGYVLFHNGSWSSWRDRLYNCAERAPEGKKLPMGEWSDTRAMAYVTSFYGPGVLTLIDEKVVLFGPKSEFIFKEPQFQKKDGIWFSNLGWNYERRRGRQTTGVTGDGYDFAATGTVCDIGTRGDWKPTMCIVQNCNRARIGNGKYCTTHTYMGELSEGDDARNQPMVYDKCVIKTCNGKPVTTQGNTRMYCREHAAGHGLYIIKDENNDPEIKDNTKAADATAPGGGSPESEFRRSAFETAARQITQERVQEGAARLLAVVSGGTQDTDEGSAGESGQGQQAQSQETALYGPVPRARRSTHNTLAPDNNPDPGSLAMREGAGEETGAAAVEAIFRQRQAALVTWAGRFNAKVYSSRVGRTMAHGSPDLESAIAELAAGNFAAVDSEAAELAARSETVGAGETAPPDVHDPA